jgi:hypothetical protein
MHSLLRIFCLILALLPVGARAAAPTIANPTATPGTNGTAKLSATVTPGGQTTTVVFSYGRTTSYGSTAAATVPAGDTAQVASVNLTGLIGGQTYNFLVNATNSDGIATPTSNITFSVAAYKPKITLLPVTHNADGSVGLRATVTANGTAGTAVFQYGPDPTAAGATETGSTAILAGDVDKSVTGTVPAPFNGDNKFRLIIRDAANVIIANSAVTKLNTAPKAVADAYTLADDEPLTLKVLDNDSDAEGDAFTIDSVTQGRFGTVTINAAKTAIVYRPKQTLFAVDTFRYTIKETVFGAIATATVTIRPLRATLGGTHGGIIRDFEGKEVGYFRITATALGSFTGVIEIEGKSYLISGNFGPDGSFHGAASRDGTLLPVDFSTVRGEDGTTIKAKFAQGKFASNVEFTDDEATTRGPLAGRYTVELPSGGSNTTTDDGIIGSDTTTTTTNTTNLPEGTGWTALKVGTDGSVRVKGRLPDGRSFSTRGALVVGPNGPQITFFDDVDETRVIGVFNVGDTVTGTFRVDRGRSGDETFPNGYDVTLTANGARYVSPDNGGGITSSTGSDAEAFTITFNGGGLSGGLTRNLKLTDSGQFKVLNGGREDLKIKVDDSSGRFTTKVTVDDNGRRVKGTGVFIQGSTDSSGGSGAGVFNGPNKPGSIQITAGSTPTPTTPPPVVLPTPNPNATPVGIDLNLQRARRR